MKIRGVLFDLDNTLTDRPRSIEIFAARFYDEFRATLDSPLSQVTDVILRGDSDGYRPKHELFDAILNDLRWHHAPELAQIEHYWFEQSPCCMQPREGLFDLLDELTHRNIKRGVITNGQTTVQNATLDAIGVRPYMQTILVSETVGLRKPDAAIFQLALSQLGLSPQETIFVGDHPLNDVHGARCAGLVAVWLSGCHDWPDDLPAAEHEIRAIGEVLSYLNV